MGAEEKGKGRSSADQAIQDKSNVPSDSDDKSAAAVVISAEKEKEEEEKVPGTCYLVVVQRAQNVSL